MRPLPRGSPCGISVVICSYRGNEQFLTTCLAGVRDQELPPCEVILVVDTASEADEYRGLITGLSGLPLRVIASGKRGLSAARNAGITASRGEIVVFLDDDAVPSLMWLNNLAAAFDDPVVIAAGGPVIPLYEGRPLPDCLAWIVGCTGETIPAVRPIGCNMALRQEAFDLCGMFDEGLGRVRDNQAIGEETELILRIQEAASGRRIVMVPSAPVTHRVPARRTTLAYITKRAWQEGLAKGRISRHHPVNAEKIYIAWYLRHPKPLPLFVLAVTAMAFLWGRLSSV